MAMYAIQTLKLICSQPGHATGCSLGDVYATWLITPHKSPFHGVQPAQAPHTQPGAIPHA